MSSFTSVVAKPPGASDAGRGPTVSLLDVRLDVPEMNIADTLKSRFLRRARRRPEIRTILSEVSFRVSAGERVGLIGRNGAGKTSLLKCIAGIYPSSRGRVEIEGRVAAVIAQGVGFDGELTLLENLRASFAYRGQIDRYDDALGKSILTFAELESRADSLFKHLSSGNQSRLAFASILHQDADILLLDEVFATGDAGFVTEAKRRMRALIDRSPILLMATHDASLAREVCTRCLLIDEGRLVHDGTPDSAISAYRQILRAAAARKIETPKAAAP